MRSLSDRLPDDATRPTRGVGGHLSKPAARAATAQVRGDGVLKPPMRHAITLGLSLCLTACATGDVESRTDADAGPRDVAVQRDTPVAATDRGAVAPDDAGVVTPDDVAPA
ncbi:MAG: hypothetical protein JWM10_1194, partial [Myxococcaceae bacterium]|nr:hypothetical protein [Myxococcaceae bacterium]